MHMDIQIIVYAEDKKQAIEKAERILDNLCGDERPFDYYEIYIDPKTKKPIAFEAESDEGKKLIKDSFEWTKKTFIENCKKLKNALDKFAPEELFDMDHDFPGNIDDTYKLYGTDFRYVARCTSKYAGPDIWLYDETGIGIVSHEHLQNILDKYKNDKHLSNEYKHLNIYVVTSDVHF